ncbi:uncharacterized protein [Rutidosis leptorrhynchoides]|uniref:uncharacterized protein n=1 Tax=Rutidosis leptorrhynchoides TaxID=125765 RepID=UPI003A991E45
MHFGKKWINWIRACLSSASISVLVNESPTEEFALDRAEGLSALIKSAIDTSLFKGIEVGKDKVLVSHLQYADDTILFGEWKEMASDSGVGLAIFLFHILDC